MARDTSQNPIGVFDSGVGGLSVLQAIQQELPDETIIYFADQAHVPYGNKPIEEIRHFSVEITRYLLSLGAKLIVVACNTASAAALYHLRDVFPEIPFVGMEPAVKPAANATINGVVGVLATPTTFQGKLYASLIERFANNIIVLQDTCPGLVSQIEAGNLNGQETRSILENALMPILDEGADHIVLGCTHYPFVIPVIQEIVANQATVIDPSPAVARQTRRLLTKQNLQASTDALQPIKGNRLRLITSGNDEQLYSLLPKLLGVHYNVEKVTWGIDLGKGDYF
jgi:glutamate racemase